MRRAEAACAAAPERSRDELLPYIDGVLQTWPDAIRRVPRRWFTAFLLPDDQGEHLHPLIALCRHLVMTYEPLDVQRCARLWQSQAMRPLTMAGLQHCGLADAHIEAMASRPSPASLAHLDLGANGVGVEGCRALVQSPLRQHLTTLALWGNPIGDDGLEAIISARWPRLERLELVRTRITDASAQMLATTKHLPALTSITLAYNPLSDARLRALKGCDERVTVER